MLFRKIIYLLVKKAGFALRIGKNCLTQAVLIDILFLLYNKAKVYL
mgnify:FL=1